MENYKIFTGEIPVKENKESLTDSLNLKMVKAYRHYKKNDAYNNAYIGYSDGQYRVTILGIHENININGFPYLSFKLKNNSYPAGSKIMHAIYYFTDSTIDESMCNLRNLLYNLHLSDITEDDLYNIDVLISKLSSLLLNVNCILKLETINNYQSSKLYAKLEMSNG